MLCNALQYAFKNQIGDNQKQTKKDPRPFLESPGNFSGPENCFMFAMFTFKIKVSIILKMKQKNYQLTKQNWLVCELGTVLLFNRFWFLPSVLSPKSYEAFREMGPTQPVSQQFARDEFLVITLLIVVMFMSQLWFL